MTNPQRFWRGSPKYQILLDALRKPNKIFAPSLSFVGKTIIQFLQIYSNVILSQTLKINSDVGLIPDREN